MRSLVATIRDPAVVCDLPPGELDLVLRTLRRARLLGRVAVLLEERGLLSELPVGARDQFLSARAACSAPVRSALWELDRVAWALDAVRAVGNYGEIFNRNLGQQSPLDLARGMNAQWNTRSGGLLYGLPIR